MKVFAQARPIVEAITLSSRDHAEGTAATRERRAAHFKGS
jgi:hypothetical protein